MLAVETDADPETGNKEAEANNADWDVLPGDVAKIADPDTDEIDVEDKPELPPYNLDLEDILWWLMADDEDNEAAAPAEEGLDADADDDAYNELDAIKDGLWTKDAEDNSLLLVEFEPNTADGLAELEPFSLDDDDDEDIDESLLLQFVVEVTIPDGLLYNADVEPPKLLCLFVSLFANETRVAPDLCVVAGTVEVEEEEVVDEVPNNELLLVLNVLKLAVEADANNGRCLYDCLQFWFSFCCCWLFLLELLNPICDLLLFK